MCGDGYRLLDAGLLVAHGEANVARCSACLQHYHELAVEESHGGLGELLERGCVAVAHALKGACSAHLEGELVGRVGTDCAIFVGQADHHVCQVLSVGLDDAAFGLQQQL